MFYLLVGMLIAIAGVFVMWPMRAPVLRHKQSIAAGAETLRTEANITLYQDQLDDLTKTFTVGNIDKAQYKQLKAELARNLLSNSEDNNNAALEANDVIHRKVIAPWFTRGFFIAGLLALPVLALVIYQHLGVNKEEWKIAEQLRYKHQLLQQSTPLDQTTLDKINRQLVEKLEGSIKKSPENTQAWILHARTAVELQAFDKAINSYQKALEQQPQSSQVMAELAQTLFISTDNRLTSVIENLSARSLAIDPNNVMALSLKGIMAFEAEKYSEAIEFWQRVLALMAPNTTDAKSLQQGIAQAQARLSTNQLAAGDSSQNHKTAAGITVKISLADNIDFRSEQTVFVYARAWQGSKMPLAIAKLQAGQLPLTLVLDESMAMSPAMTLSSVKQLELVARLSLSGSPIAKTGDWQASYGPVTLAENTESYSLIINRVVQ